MSGFATRTRMRETLESIRDRFVADDERIVLFTTFNFVPGFFETNVLPLLVGESAEDLKNNPQVRYGINEELRKLRCLVVCDQSTQPPAKGDLRYGLLPVGLPNGRFHPKLMLMAGTLRETGAPGMWLAVGSGNLSLSGWAINREVIGAVPVCLQHAEEMLPLLHWLLAKANDQLCGRDVKEEGGVRAILGDLATRLADRAWLQPEMDGAPSLHLALPWHRQQGLIAALAGQRRWQHATIISPYWGQVDSLVRELGVKECRFVPSLAAGQFRFPLASLGEQTVWKRSFASFGDDRYTHAKVMLLEDEEKRALLCVGSANFTGAALDDPASSGFANIEAVLRHELPAVPRQWRKLQVLDESRLEEADGAEEQAPPLPPFEVSLFYDWQRRQFDGVVTIGRREPVSNVVLHVAGMKIPVDGAPGEPVVLSCECTCRQPVRSFSVNWTDGGGKRAVFHGLVIQVNAEDDQLLYQPRPRLDDVLGFLRSLNPAQSADEVRRRSLLDGESGGDGDEDEREPSFDYFGLFQATWKLREFYSKQDVAKLAAIAFDGSSRHSMTTLYRAIVLQPDQTDEKRIARFVQLCEVRELLDWLRARNVAPTADSALADIGREIAGLTPVIGRMLQNSPSFRDMFGNVPAQERIDAFIGWFQREFSNRGAVHGR